MNSVDVFLLALGPESLWIVKEVELKEVEDSGKKALHIYIDFTKGSEFIKLGEENICKGYNSCYIQ